MSSEKPTREEVLASIVPKSDQLNADSLVTGPITVTITKVSRGDKDQPIVVEIKDQQPYKPCKSMRRVLIATFGEDPAAWVGQQMTLFCDPTVMWAGVAIGGIRISHLSGIEKPKTFLLTKTRGKKAEFTIHPIKIKKPPELSPEDQEFIAISTKTLKEAESLDDLQTCGQVLHGKSQAVRDALHPLYTQRTKELTAQTKGEV